MPKKYTRKLTSKNVSRAFKAIQKKKVKSLTFKYLFNDVMQGHFDYVEKTLKLESTDLTLKLSMDGENIMHACARSLGGEKMCELVYDAGGGVMMNEMNNDNLTPLHVSLGFNYSCEDRDRDTALWFLNNGALLIPFPDNVKISEDIQKSMDNIHAYMADHIGAKRYDPKLNENRYFTEYNNNWENNNQNNNGKNNNGKNNNNNNKNNNQNQKNNNQNNNSSVGNSVFNNNNNNINENYEDPEFEVSLKNMKTIYDKAKELETQYVRKLKFTTLQQSTVVEVVPIFADIRMTVKQLKDYLRNLYVGENTNFDLLVKQKGETKVMADSEKLSQYGVQNDTTLTIVLKLVSGETRRKRKK